MAELKKKSWLENTLSGWEPNPALNNITANPVKMSSIGEVPGMGNGDTVDIKATPGEVVIPNGIGDMRVKDLLLGVINLNKQAEGAVEPVQRFQQGGMVGDDELEKYSGNLGYVPDRSAEWDRIAESENRRLASEIAQRAASGQYELTPNLDNGLGVFNELQKTMDRGREVEVTPTKKGTYSMSEWARGNKKVPIASAGDTGAVTPMGIGAISPAAKAGMLQSIASDYGESAKRATMLPLEAQKGIADIQGTRANTGLVESKTATETGMLPVNILKGASDAYESRAKGGLYERQTQGEPRSFEDTLRLEGVKNQTKPVDMTSTLIEGYNKYLASLPPQSAENAWTPDEWYSRMINMGKNQSGNAGKQITPEDIAFTAKKYKISEEEVKKRLGIR